MTVHLYAQCWNDEWMLPFFFRHYDPLVDRYFIYDDGSTDATLALLRSHPKVAVRRFERSDPHSFVLSEQAFSNACWKESTGRADWVIVTDIDEHLYHPAWQGYLRHCRDRGISAIPALGFQMISEQRPRPGQNLCQEYRLGAPWAKMLKLSIFDPNAITEINFATGRHRADPMGRIALPASDEMLLFHYKYMGLAETHQRHLQLRQGLGATDIAKSYGTKYSWPEEELKADWQAVAGNAVDTAALDNPKAHFSKPPWWEKYRR